MQREETLEQEQSETTLEKITGQDQETTQDRQEALGLRLVHGGKSGGETGDWLTPLPDRCFFIAEHKKNSDATNLFRVIWRGRRARLLRVTTKVSYLGKSDYELLYVDPSSFCKKWNLVEVIDIEVEEEEGVVEEE